MLKKTILVVLMSATPLLSIAQNWVPVANGAGVTFHVDPKTIKKSGDIRKVWVLHDRSQKDPDGNQSTKIYKEYHCAEDKVRFLQLDAYEGNMGSGRFIESETGVTKWTYISPNSLESIVLEFVCKK